MWRLLRQIIIGVGEGNCHQGAKKLTQGVGVILLLVRQRPRKTTTESSILAERCYHFGVFGKGLERQKPWKTSTEKSILAERG